MRFCSSFLPMRRTWTCGGGCRGPNAGSSRGLPSPSLAGRERRIEDAGLKPGATCGWLRGRAPATASRRARQALPSCIGPVPAVSADGKKGGGPFLQGRNLRSASLRTSKPPHSTTMPLSPFLRELSTMVRIRHDRRTSATSSPGKGYSIRAR